MTKFYVKPDAAQMATILEALTLYHGRLQKIDLRLAVLMVHEEKNQEEGELVPALTLHGIPALAISKVLPLKLRAHGLPDVEILFDGDAWQRLSKPRRMAVIDHELTHFEPQLDDAGVLKVDDLGRPKVKMRHHDHNFGWFDEVARRHKVESIEVRQAVAFADEHGQFYFPFEWRPTAAEPFGSSVT